MSLELKCDHFLLPLSLHQFSCQCAVQHELSAKQRDGLQEMLHAGIMFAVGTRRLDVCVHNFFVLFLFGVANILLHLTRWHCE